MFSDWVPKDGDPDDASIPPPAAGSAERRRRPADPGALGGAEALATVTLATATLLSARDVRATRAVRRRDGRTAASLALRVP